MVSQRLAALAVAALIATGAPVIVTTSAQAAPTVTAGQATTTYLTERGDTLRQVAREFEVSWRALYRANNDKVSPHPDRRLRPGIRLTIRVESTPIPTETPIPTPTPQPAPVPAPVPAQPSNEVQKIIDLVNAERVKAGVPALRVSTCATDYAQNWSGTMAATQTMVHRTNLSEVMRACAARGIGENIAYGQRTPEAVMTSWMNSTGHRANILRSSYTHIGVGLAQSSEGRLYWTQNFLTIS